MKLLKKKWYWFLAISIFFIEAILLFLWKNNLYVGICDNLDLFITQLKMLRDQNAFFAQNYSMPILSQIDRNYFPTEFSFYNLLYLFLPDEYAYIMGYLFKVLFSFLFCRILAHYILKERYEAYEAVIVLIAAAYALLPLYPMYAICFASMPYILYLLIRVYREPKWYLYVGVFCYPFFSYFSFFGIFILGYLCIAIIILWIKDKKISLPLVGALVLLTAGYICFEYRLFAVMFGDSGKTIRDSMIIKPYDAKMLLHVFTDSFLFGNAHSRSAHIVVVLPVCTYELVKRNIGYIQKHQIREIIYDKFNITLAFIIFNVIVCTLYYAEPVRNLIEKLLPPLTGFNYGRTLFFNAFAWYLLFFISIKDIYDKWKKTAVILCVLAICAVGSKQCEYSDFYNTLYYNTYKAVKHTEVNQLSYSEFYGQELFNGIKDEISYHPSEKVCAYGFHPAQLSYNGISTIDGYCGYYSEAYKERFRKVIEPTLERNEKWKDYYDNWGCRAYLFSESGENTYDFGANAESMPQDILIDATALKQMDCRYIFSRFEIENATQMQLDLCDKFENEIIPYAVYVYRLKYQ